MPSDFTVVGGGIAGLVVARSLAKSGRSVTLVEASDHLGGAVLRHEVAGIDLDAGADGFSARGGAVAALAAELGLGNDIVSPSAAGAWLQPAAGPAVPLPARSVLGIPGVPLAADVIAVVGSRSAFRAQLDSVIPHLVATKSLTLGSLVRRRMGAGVLEKLVTPVVRGVHSVDPDDLSIDRAVPGLRRALALHGSLAAAVRSLPDATPAATEEQGIRGGLWRLIEELVADLETYHVDVQLGRRVAPTDRLDGVVVLATPIEKLAGRDVVLATLVVDSPDLDATPRGTGVLVAKGPSGIKARALTHATAKWEWLRERAGGHHVLRLSYDSAVTATTARADAEALLGVQFERVIDYAQVAWMLPVGATADVGEAVAGPGLTGIVSQATKFAAALLEASE